MRFLISIIFLVSSIAGAQQSGVFKSIKLLPSTLPSYCAQGDMRFDTSAGFLNVCSSSNTWSAFTLNSTGPLTTLGDLLYENSTPALTRLAGNTTSTKKFLSQTGTGTISAAPAWSILSAGDIPNLDFSKVTTGTVPIAQGGTGQTSQSAGFNALSPITTKGDLVVGNGANSNTRIGVGTDGYFLKADSSQSTGVIWAQTAAGGVGIDFVGLSTAWILNTPDDINAETSVGNWLAYADAAGTVPVDMTGGSPSSTCLRTTTAGHILNGAGSFEFVKGAANRQGEGCSVLVNIPPGYRGQNAELSLSFKVQSGSISSGDLILAAYDVTNSALLSMSGASVVNDGLLQANLVIPSSTAQMRVGFHFSSTSTTAVTFDFDDVILGPPNNIGIAAIADDWKSDLTFTPSAGFGTTTLSDFRYKRIGDTMYVRGFWKAGTAAASVASIGMPSGYTLDTSKLSANSNGIQIGSWSAVQVSAASALASANFFNPLFYDGSTNGTVFVGLTSTSSTFDKVNATSLIVNNGGFNFEFSVPITQWENTGTAFRPDQVANLWQGYHDSTCSFSVISGTFAEFSADATCALTEDKNTNFGTVTTYKIGGNPAPGIVFTPSGTGMYEICATMAPSFSSTSTGVAMRMTDGTTTIVDLDSVSGSAFSSGNTMCGQYSASAGVSTTIKLLGAIGGGQTLSIQRQSGIARGAIEWTVKKLTSSIPAPLIVNGVVSQSNGVTSIAALSAFINGTNITTNTGAFSFTSFVGDGTCTSTWAISPNTFSGTPVCTVTDGTRPAKTQQIKTISSTSIQFFDGDAGSNCNGGAERFNLICMGPH